MLINFARKLIVQYLASNVHNISEESKYVKLLLKIRIINSLWKNTLDNLKYCKIFEFTCHTIDLTKYFKSSIILYKYKHTKTFFKKLKKKRMRNIRYLHASYNSCFYEIKYFKYFENVYKLKLFNHNFNYLDIAKFFPKLKILHLSFIINFNIKNITELKELTVKSYNKDDTWFKLTDNDLLKMHNLKHLKLYYQHELTDNGFKNLKNLESIDIKYNYYKTKFTNNIVKYFPKLKSFSSNTVYFPKEIFNYCKYIEYIELGIDNKEYQISNDIKLSKNILKHFWKLHTFKCERKFYECNKNLLKYLKNIHTLQMNNLTKPIDISVLKDFYEVYIMYNTNHHTKFNINYNLDGNYRINLNNEKKLDYHNEIHIKITKK